MQNILQVSHIRVSYGQSRIIDDLSFNVAQSEIVALMGLNGMGKTTLMKALIGLLPLGQGSVRLAGEELGDKAPFERVAMGLAYVPQGRMVFPTLTVEENIATGLRSNREDVPDEIYDIFPVLKEMRKRRAGNLSGGQQQQLVIARALAARPRVLLLDEPTEGIQPSIIKELASVLRSLRGLKNLTILVSEQVLSFAMAAADRLLILNRGRLVHQSPCAGLDVAHVKGLLSI